MHLHAELPTRRIALAGAAIALTVALAVGAVFAWLRHADLPPGGAQTRSLHDTAVPGPPLQTAPQPDLQRYHEEKQRERNATLPPAAGIDQRLDAQLPPDLPLVDSLGRPVRLGDYFGDRPLLLVLGYYRCPQLCGLLMHGLLEALHASRLPRREFRILRVSVDPGDDTASAAARREVDLAYADLLEGMQSAPQPLELQLLTAQAPALKALTHSVGFRYERTEGPARFAHPAAVIVLTPQGRVSRYLMGVRFDPWDLRLALVDAGEGRTGDFSDRVALLCAHFDPRTGAHSAAVMASVRGLALLLVALLATLWWRRRGASR
jgi:protein SCO1/2